MFTGIFLVLFGFLAHFDELYIRFRQLKQPLEAEKFYKLSVKLRPEVIFENSTFYLIIRVCKKF